MARQRVVQSLRSMPISPVLENQQISPGCTDHLARIKSFYDNAPVESGWFGRQYRKLLADYYKLLIPAQSSVIEIGCGSGELLARLPNRDVTGIDVSGRQIERAHQRIPHGTFFVQDAETLQLDRSFDFIILSETVNFAADVQAIFQSLLRISHPGTRLILNYHSNLWHPILALAVSLGLKAPSPATNWLTTEDVRNLLSLSDWEELKVSPRILMPVRLLGLGILVNRYLAPFLPWFCLSVFVVARPRARFEQGRYSVSVVVPARNEAGNIVGAVRRIPNLGERMEIIFVEGHSRDNTWGEIQKVAAENPGMTIRCLRQTGKGKGNAVREAFEVATGDILIILDADLTVPPEELPKFYEALSTGKAEFANGVRLVYPMDERAMQFLNLCANKLFSLVFTWLLGQSVKDTLCGTKALFKRDYQRIASNRSYFGDFDPFGDFDLLFGADKLHLKMADIPIRYRERTYGETNIQRWRHGTLLLRMVVFAARKLKFV
jgi:SAM-dependent methyltransferase